MDNGGTPNHTTLSAEALAYFRALDLETRQALVRRAMRRAGGAIGEAMEGWLEHEIAWQVARDLRALMGA